MQEQLSLPIGDVKHCKRCGEQKGLGEFYEESRNRDGRSGTCRACEALARDPQNNRARAIAWQLANPQRAKARKRAWQVRTRDERRDEQRSSLRAWRVANPEKFREQSRSNNLRRRARRRAAFVENVVGLTVWEMHGGCCGICGEFVASDAFHVDHIVPLSRGGAHSYANTQPAHPVCNMRKGNRLASAPA